MQFKKRRLSILAMLLALFIPGVFAASDQEAKIGEVIEVLDAIQKIPEDKIPPALLGNAYGIAIVPSVVKVGFVIGGRYGKGVVAIRREDGAWSDPVFVSITGGSLGWQIGAQSTDVVLVFKSRKSIDGLINGKFTLGADAAVAAGPVGRMASASTDAQLKAEIYSYSRSRGLFAGVALDGAALQIKREDNAGYYSQPGITASQIFVGENRNRPVSAEEFAKRLKAYAAQ